VENVAAPIVPSPEALKALRPTSLQGLAVTGLALGSTAAALWLSLNGGWIAWAAGQVLLAASLVIWFAVLHECGHRTLFPSRAANTAVGFVAGFFAMIPYRCWTRVHGRHHKWTGWQDLDPTTESLVPRPLQRFERLAINLCWRLWIPLFSTLYRLDNFWSPRRLATLFPKAADRRPMRRNSSIQLLTYGALVVLAGPGRLVEAAALGIVLSLVVEDLLLLSQHTHVPQNVSHGANVAPVPAVEQEIFTRSLRLPEWISAALLHIDAHELHHMFPFVPGYHLRRIAYRPSHEVGWWTWVRSSKRLEGVVLLFENRRHTGFPF
jgi:omega-6 fatty acid desaturase (delta-12 desaturase)